MSVTLARAERNPRSRNPRGQGDRLRSELLDTAADLIAEHGSLDRVSLRAVAARTGVTAPSIYRHFDDRHSLLVAAVHHCWEEFATALLEAADRTSDPYERFMEAGQAYLRFALEHPGKYRVMFGNKVELGADDRPVGLCAFDHLVVWVRDVLDDRGDDRDPHFVAVQVHTWIHGIVDLVGCHPHEPWPPAKDLLASAAHHLQLEPR